MKKLLTIVFVAILIVTAASWLTTVAYGHENDSIQLNGETGQGIQITPAPQANAPAVTFYGSSIGSIAAGDLFYIDTTGVAQDITVNLYLTNTEQLINNLRYLTMEVAVYYETAPGQWEKALTPGGGDFPTLFLTMRNGMVTFDLPGLANYRVTIEHGNYNSHSFGGNQENIVPAFFLEAVNM